MLMNVFSEGSADFSLFRTMTPCRRRFHLASFTFSSGLCSRCVEYTFYPLREDGGHCSASFSLSSPSTIPCHLSASNRQFKCVCRKKKNVCLLTTLSLIGWKFSFSWFTMISFPAHWASQVIKWKEQNHCARFRRWFKQRFHISARYCLNSRSVSCAERNLIPTITSGIAPITSMLSK